MNITIATEKGFPATCLTRLKIFSFAQLKKILSLHSAHENHAGMVELVDTLDLGSSAARRGGSSPSTRTQLR